MFQCSKLAIKYSQDSLISICTVSKVLIIFLVLSLNNILLLALKERIKTCSNSFQAFGMLNGRDLRKKINLLRF